MPLNKKTYKKRRPMRRRKFTRRAKSLAMLRYVTPNKHLVKLRYSQTLSLNASAGLATANVFSANGLYDPDTTGVGHQPIGFDEWMGLYNHYTVIFSSCKADFFSSGGTAVTDSAFVGIGLRAGTTINTSIDDVMELPHTRKNRLTNHYGGGSAGVHNSANISRFLGIRNLLSSSIARGSVSTQPAEQAFWHLIVSPISGTADPAAITCRMSITYIAVLTEPVDLLGS